MDAVSLLVPPEERAMVRAKAFRMTGCARGWANAAGQNARSDVCSRLCLLVSAMAPELPADELLLLVRYALWTIALDDRLDQPVVARGVLRRLRRQMVRVARRTPRSAVRADGYPTGYGGGPGGGYLTTEMGRLLATFADYDADGLLVGRLAGAVCDAVDSSLSLRRIMSLVDARLHRPPTVAEYLSLSSRDVNYRSFALGLLILVGDRLGAGPLDRIESALDPACRAVRLANDLRSVGRDAASRRFNVLSLPGPTGRAPTTADVERWIGDLVEAHRVAIREACGTAAAASAAALERCLDLSVGLYRVSDLR